ncbi:unnamed protein product [Darwinula stevensoni]|uniref:CSD domain-containing protein n=1 Tax=Darwinula stevensoni TaxID=69355 RepID=A0A7R8X2X4_9CRUS|nr:unnamed protein product [Darwinula stevensoni]CAG0884398.1 unnamed protein product [Darwinula stevensoni]
MSLNPQWSPFQPPLNSDLDTSAILDLKLNQASNRNTSMNLGTLGSKAPGGLTGRPQALLSQVGLFGTGTVTTSSNFLSNSSAASTLFSNNAGVIGSSSTSNSLFGIAPTITTPSYINFPKGISGNSGSTRSVGSLGLNGSSNGPGFGPTGGNAGLGIGLSNGASTNNSLLSMVPNHARNVALSSLSSKSNSQLISSSAFGLGNSANSSPTNLLRNVNAGSGLSSPFSGNSSSFFSERPTSSRVSPIPNNLMGAIGRESPGLFRSQSQPASSSPPGGDIFSQADMFFPDSMGNSGSKMFQGGTSSSNMFKNSGSHSLSGNNDQGNQGLRETGIIEKLLHSYGFIQCCERQARLFFHFSQFDGNIEHLKIGDPVEFEMTYDRRTGKPIASAVTKISSDVLTQQVLGEERVMGTVTTAILNEGESNEVQGRISYENRGECFFLPYGKGDIEGNVNLRPGDKVSFQIATDQRTGNLAARCVRLEDPAQPVRYQGVVCSMKDNFGFIERGDVVREIFFHLTECKGEVKLGQDVEFSIQTRNGKEVATNITLLPAGTVIFEDVEAETIKGQVLKTVEKGAMRQPNEPLSGRIRFRGKDRSEVEIQFGERDMKGEFSLRHGDWVCFNIATDRRDKLQRATNISLLDESFVVSGEKREQGIISTLKEDLGYIKCVEREANLFFNVNEVLDVSQKLAVDNEVEFTVIQVLLYD